MLQWIEAISSSTTFDPSPMLLHTTEGAVVMTGYMECQEFAHESNSMGISPLRPMMNRKLGTNPDLTGRGILAARPDSVVIIGRIYLC